MAEETTNEAAETEVQEQSTEEQATETAEQRVSDVLSRVKSDAEDAVDDQADGDEADVADEDDGEATESDSDAPTLTRRQLNAAKKFGLSEEDAEGLPAAVRDKLVKMDSDLGRRYSELGRAKESKPEDSTGDDDSSFDIELPDYDFSNDDGVFDEKEAAALNQLKAGVAMIADQLKSVLGSVGGLDEFRESIESERYVQKADRFFDTVDGLDDVFGEGSLSDLGDGPEAEARLALIEEAGYIMRGAEAVGRPMSFDEAHQQALYKLHGDRLLEQASENGKKAIAAKARKRRATAANRPNQRGTRAPSDEPRTMDDVAADLKGVLSRHGLG